MSLFTKLGLCLALAMSFVSIDVVAMNKAELIDAIASESKLSKADAKRVLDAFVNQTSNALRKGDRIALVGFGTFGVSERVASSDGCDSEADVDFYAAPTFNAAKEGGRHTPFHNRVAGCPEGGYDGVIITDEILLGDIISEYKLAPEDAAAAYNALLDIIIQTVNEGEKVDIGDEFGAFFEETEVYVMAKPKKAAKKPKADPRDAEEEDQEVTEVEITIQVQGLDDDDLRALIAIAEATARKGSNPQTGKEIKLAAKKKVRFKAGAELADKVKK